MTSAQRWRELQFLAHQGQVCLPYGINLLDLSRWFSIGTNANVERTFQLVAGSNVKDWSGQDVIKLYSDIQIHCLGYSLADSYVIDGDTLNSIYVFDQFQRYSMFSAPPDIVSKLYPFPREIMWEHFALLQDNDADCPLAELFSKIHGSG